MYLGYEFYFKIGSDVLTLPITPSELKIKSGSNNKVVTLINEGDINIIKPTGLMEIEFEARFPMRQYPYAREYREFTYYFNKFTSAKQNKQPVRFSVVRSNMSGKLTWGTGSNEDNLFSIEELETKENADNGDDVIVSFRLKQYKEYGVKTIKLPESNPTTTSTSDTSRSTYDKTSNAQTHTVKSGDCLWNIAKTYYGNGSKYTVIYEANKTVIEETAKKHGKSSSSNGHWIYTGTVLTIPSL